MAMPFIVGPPILLTMIFLILRGDRHLVRRGEISIGTVTGIRNRRRGRIATYEFLDRSGRVISASCYDNTRSIVVGIQTPVFYNLEDPQRDQIALFGSSYEVVENTSD
jgi:hypothetical protein